MKIGVSFMKMFFRFLVVLSILLVSAELSAARRSKNSKGRKGGKSDEARIEFKANEMLSRGLEFIEQKQEERGIKLISSIPKMFPQSRTRFKAFAALGDFYLKKRKFDLAIKKFQVATKSENKDIQAETLYKIGICFYNLSQYDKAFMMLRQVTNKYPWSVYANEAYYYIGLCHFKLNRWSRAVDALKMVGTSVPPATEDKHTFAEAGQRLFIKIYDEDLIVLLSDKKGLSIKLKNTSGDEETVKMKLLGRRGVNYIGSIPTGQGKPVKNDAILQCNGGEKITAYYDDINTESGKRNQQVVLNIDVVSSASIGFTDGAYREYTKGIYGDQPFFVRIKDIDKDISPKRDTLTATINTFYVEKKQADLDKGGVNIDEQEVTLKERDSIKLVLKETENNSGVFVGSSVLKTIKPDTGTEINLNDSQLCAMRGDSVLLEYVDDKYMGGQEPRVLKYKAKVLIGAINDVKIEHREVNDIGIKAQKNLIEAELYLKLAKVFKEVGLQKYANRKANDGLDKVKAVIVPGIKGIINREMLEKAFNIKWELLLVKNDLRKAIAVCRQLIAIFPNSTLVDKALMRVADAKLAEDKPKEFREGISILLSIVALPKSNLRAEAQYKIAEATEKNVKNSQAKEKNYSRAMLEYQKCFQKFPESPFAGMALDKTANYYIKNRDYSRAAELMERVIIDYPDASFLDKMLFKWAYASLKLGDLNTAKEKCDQLINEYPDSKAAGKAKRMQRIINKKLGVQ